MGAISSILGTEGIGAQEPTYQILDLTYGRHAIVLDDVSKLIGIGNGIPMPLIGFQYETITSLPLIDFSYSEYPYLNRTVITNAFIENQTEFTIRAHKPITQFDTFVVNYALNEVLLSLLRKYARSGGLFTILTPFEVIKNCGLKRLVGVSEKGEMAGQSFDFTFQKLNIPQEIAQAQGSFLESITQGTAI